MEISCILVFVGGNGFRHMTAPDRLSKRVVGSVNAYKIYIIYIIYHQPFVVKDFGCSQILTTEP